jgi:rifampicin phosphotransferase
LWYYIYEVVAMSMAIVALADAGGADRMVLGGKASALAELTAAGFAIPPGFVIIASAVDETGWQERVGQAAADIGAVRFAVRSSGAAEDLPDASYAGLYETFLNVPIDGLADAVRQCFAAAESERVTAYHQRHGGRPAAMAVLVQAMVDPVAAGVAFTADPLTGDRQSIVVAAVAGLGERLVSGQAVGEQWTVARGQATRTRPGADGEVLTAGQAGQVAELARRVADHYDGWPQDIEWAIDHTGRLWLLQARPMTALPEPVSWTAPGPGLWMRNFRLGEWLPEAVTPLFETWLLPAIEDGYLDGMHDTVGVRVPFRYAIVNGWYYNATPIPSPRLLGRILVRGRRRAVKVLFNALIRVGRNPVAADRALLSDLDRCWREEALPAYRRLVADTAAQVAAQPQRLPELVDHLGRQAGIALWYLAIVGGSAWKMEAALTRFVRRYLASVLPDSDGGAQVLLRGLPGARQAVGPHAVYSVDWYHPLAGDLPAAPPPSADRGAELSKRRVTAEQACRTALADRPQLLADLDALLAVNQRYAVIREQQAGQFTLGWPVLRTCVQRIGEHLGAAGVLDDSGDVFFCHHDEIQRALSGSTDAVSANDIADRRTRWQRQRRLAAPLTLGRPARLIGDVIDRAVQNARAAGTVDEGTIVGHPASAGRATGEVRIVDGPGDFAAFGYGQILVAKATAPMWAPLFARAAAVVTDGGTLAAHASLVAREYGIPAVVGTGDATLRLHDGQTVTVDGTAGTVTVYPAK